MIIQARYNIKPVSMITVSAIGECPKHSSPSATQCNTIVICLSSGVFRHTVLSRNH